MTVIGIAFTIALTTLLLLAVRMHRHQLDLATTRRLELDGLVAERTHELNQKITDLEHSKAALETARAQADAANAAKSTFLANMSHELRTPLNAIIGFSDIMRRELMGAIGTPAYRGYSEDIHFSGSHLLSVINDILDLSKIEAGKFDLREETFRLHDVIDEVQRLIASKAEAGKVTILNEVPAEVGLRADMRAIRQIAVNLLSNAVKFTPDGGTVRIHCATLTGGTFALKFSDTGCGIAEKDMTRVFEMFGQAQYNHARTGTGLGLNIARSLARIHGGELTLESSLGVGTTATVTLPGERQTSGQGHTGAFAAA